MEERNLLTALDVGSRAVIPIIVLCYVLRRRRITKRSLFFLIFIIISFALNVPTFFFNSSGLRWKMFSILSLLESVFIYFFSLKFIPSLRSLRQIWISLIVLLWFFSFGKVWSELWPFDVTPFFNTITNAMLALMSAVILFKMVSDDDSVLRIPDFWFFSGLFIYKFSTVLLVAFIPFSFLSDMWYLHSLYYFFGSIFFLIGFCREN